MTEWTINGMVSEMTHHDYFDAEFDLIEAYDFSQLTYEYAYRHCFMVAVKMTRGLW